MEVEIGEEEIIRISVGVVVIVAVARISSAEAVENPTTVMLSAHNDFAKPVVVAVMTVGAEIVQISDYKVQNMQNP